MLETEYGLGYLDECLGISLTYQRKFQRDRDVPPSSTILLRIRPFTSEDDSAHFNLFPEQIQAIP
jgi:LPS-assembly protein